METHAVRVVFFSCSCSGTSLMLLQQVYKWCHLLHATNISCIHIKGEIFEIFVGTKEVWTIRLEYTLRV